MSYLNRAMQSADPRYLQIMHRLGLVPPGLIVTEPAPLPNQPGGPPDHAGQLKAARQEYERVTGKRPFNGWDIAELHKRIADFMRGNAGNES